MTTSVLAADNRIHAYLGELETALDRTERSAKLDILREIRAHILDSIDATQDRDCAAQQVLQRLGSPRELAERYRTEYLLARAGSSFSPWILLRTTWNWARLGIRGVLAFLLALFGYCIALSLTIAVLLKPFVPRVGMWVGPEGLNIGVPNHPEVMHEVLGKSFIPVMAVFAFAFAIGTTHALRWVIRKRTQRAIY